MDFRAVLEKLLDEFSRRRIKYALIGGFALGLRGGGRTTVDIDFLVNKDDIAEVDEVMRGLNYECLYRSENVSQYVSPLRILGEVDFLHAFREASLEMIERAEVKEAFGTLKIPVLMTEDLIGLKLQAIKNDPSRKEHEIEDIKSLISMEGGRLDWPKVEHYAKILEMEDFFRRLKEGGV